MNSKMKNFTVGPVTMAEEILTLGAEQIPYFRTPEFSKVMLENEKMILQVANAPEGSRAVFLTGSGTSGMEAAVINLFDKKDKVLVVNGGSFGKRFSDICETYGIPHEDIVLESGKSLKSNDLARFEGKGFTGLLVNIHETSTGVLYDASLLADFCRRNKLKFVVDAISSFLADELNMCALGATAVIIGSQKAIALPPGISVILLSPSGVACAQEPKSTPCYYLDLKSALKDGIRGQTPFTPAVQILLQMHRRLSLVLEKGIQSQIAHTRLIAEDFRRRIQGFPFQIASENCSNAVTPLCVLPECKLSAYEIFHILKDEYGIFVCPNGGALQDKIFRVGHIGALSISDNDVLIEALSDLKKKQRI